MLHHILFVSSHATSAGADWPLRRSITVSAREGAILVLFGFEEESHCAGEARDAAGRKLSQERADSDSESPVIM